MREVLDQLEHLMYGHNYQVTFGMDIYDNCSSLDDFKINLKKNIRTQDLKLQTLFPLALETFGQKYISV